MNKIIIGLIIGLCLIGLSSAGLQAQEKEVMKEYGFEEIEKEVKKMCNLGEMIARENIEKGHSIGLEQGLVQGQKLERRKKKSFDWYKKVIATNGEDLSY